MIFPERNDSFDFLHAIEEYRKAYRIEKGLDKPESKNIVTKDFSLAEGEKMTLTIEGVTKHEGHQTKQKSGLKKLAAPKGFQPSAAAPKPLDLFDSGAQSNPSGLDGLLDSNPQPQTTVDVFANSETKPANKSSVLDINFSDT